MGNRGVTAGVGRLILGIALPVLAAGCVSDPADAPVESEEGLRAAPGALVDATLKSRVGVVLDEIPRAERAVTAGFYLAQPLSFWTERTKQQLRHTNYRSAKLGGIACMYAAALTSATVGERGTPVSFTCPSAREAREPGGSYAMYVAPVLPTDGAARVHLHAVALTGRRRDAVRAGRATGTATGRDREAPLLT